MELEAGVPWPMESRALEIHSRPGAADDGPRVIAWAAEVVEHTHLVIRGPEAFVPQSSP